MPGQFYDAESSLFYNWNRYYNPATDRYISSDPIGLEGGINTFLYAAASPVMMIDPEGLQLQMTAQNTQAACSLYPAACAALLSSARAVAAQAAAAATPIIAAAAPMIATGGAALGTGLAIGYYGTDLLAQCLSNETAEERENNAALTNGRQPAKDVQAFLNCPTESVPQIYGAEAMVNV